MHKFLIAYVFLNTYTHAEELNCMAVKGLYKESGCCAGETSSVTQCQSPALTQLTVGDSISMNDEINGESTGAISANRIVLDSIQIPLDGMLVAENRQAKTRDQFTGVFEGGWSPYQWVRRSAFENSTAAAPSWMLVDPVTGYEPVSTHAEYVRYDMYNGFYDHGKDVANLDLDEIVLIDRLYRRTNRNISSAPGKELNYLTANNPYNYRFFANVKYGAPQSYRHAGGKGDLKKNAQSGMSKKIKLESYLFMNSEDPVPDGGSVIMREDIGRRHVAVPLYKEVEREQAALGIGEYENHYTLEKRWNVFCRHMRGFLGQIERRDYLSTPANLPNIGTDNIPNIEAETHYGPREYGTISTPDMPEMQSAIARKGIHAKADVTKARRSVIRDHLEMFYDASPYSHALPLPEARARSNITDYSLFGWNTFVTLRGSETVLNNKELLVSNRRTREQKRMPDAYAHMATNEYNEFFLANVKLPILIPDHRPFDFMIRDESYRVMVPEGLYYISELVNVLEKLISPYGVHVYFNYAQTQQNVVRFEPNAGVDFKINLPTQDQYTANDVSDQQITRILGFSSNPAGFSQIMYTIGDANMQWALSAARIVYPFQGLNAIEQASNQLYSSKAGAYNAYEALTGDRRYYTETLGQKFIVTVSNSSLMKFESDTEEISTTSQGEGSPLLGMTLTFDPYKATVPIYSQQVLKAIRVSRDVDERVTVEFEPLVVDQVFQIPIGTGGGYEYGLTDSVSVGDTLDPLVNGARDSEGQLITETRNGVTYRSGENVNDGVYAAGTRIFMKLERKDLGDVDLRGFAFTDIYSMKFYEDRFELFDNSIWQSITYELDGNTENGYQTRYTGYYHAIDAYDGYEGLYNLIRQRDELAKFTHPCPESSTSCSRDGLNLEIDNIKEIDLLGATEVLVRVKPDVTSLTSFQDVKTTQISQSVISTILTEANAKQLVLERVVPPLSDDMTLHDFLGLCYHLYVYSMSEEHAFTSYAALEAGDGINMQIRQPYSSLDRIWRRTQKPASQGGELLRGYTRHVLHASTNGDNLMHGYDWLGEWNPSGPGGHYWRYPAKYTWSRNELPSDHCTNTDLYGGMTMAERKYMPISHSLDCLYEIHNKYVPGTVSGGLYNKNLVGGEPVESKLYAWPVYATNVDADDRRSNAAQSEAAPVFGVFKKDYIKELMMGHPDYDSSTGLLHGKPLPRVGYYFQENVNWVGTFRPGGVRAEVLLREDLMHHANLFMASVGEPIYDLWVDNEVTYVYLDERQNLGGSWLEKHVLYSRIGENRPTRYGMSTYYGWPVGHPHSAQEYNVPVIDPIGTFVEQFFDLIPKSPKDENVFDYRYGYSPATRIPGNKEGEAQRREIVRQRVTEYYGNEIGNAKATAYSDLKTITYFDPIVISALFPRVNSNGTVIGPGSVLIGTKDKPVRVMHHRGTVATSGGRVMGQNGVGRKADGMLGEHTTFRSMGNFDRLFATGGNYPSDVYDHLMTDDQWRWQPNQVDVFGAPVRLEASGTLVYDPKLGDDFMDYKNYVSLSSGFDLPHNQVDITMDMGVNLNIFFRSCGLTRDAVERLTTRPPGDSTSTDIVAEYLYQDAITDSANNFFIPGIGYMVPKKFAGGSVTMNGVSKKVVLPPVGSVQTKLRPDWVEQNVGFNGIENIDLFELPFATETTKHIRFEEPLTHQDYYAIRPLQMLFQPEEEYANITQKKLSSTEFDNHYNSVDAWEKLGGADFEKYTGSFAGFRYPSGIDSMALEGHQDTNTLFKTIDPTTRLLKDSIDITPSYGDDISAQTQYSAIRRQPRTTSMEPDDDVDPNDDGFVDRKISELLQTKKGSIEVNEILASGENVRARIGRMFNKPA